MHDHFWLYNAPEYLDAVKWSQDNLLAVAAAHTVVILNPSQLDGARSYVTIREPDTGALAVGCKPFDPGSSNHFQAAARLELRMKEQLYHTHVRSAAWSPAGATPQGGCYLVTVTNDFKVCDMCASGCRAVLRGAVLRCVAAWPTGRGGEGP